ncbi:unnamed protein product [Tilletia controversa]|nr:unnamed protein product [Tilletia controversa]
MSSQLAPLRVHRLQHLDPPSHHVFTAIPSKGNGGGNGIGIGIGAWLPHWNAVPERFFHPRHRSGHPNHDPADPPQDLDEHPDTHLLRIGFQNPWPSFIRPSFSQIWHALRWGVPPPHFEPDTSHTEPKELRRRMRNDPELHLAVQTPDFTHQHRSVKATWLGHAGTLLTVPPLNARTEPFRILFDPIFSNRCSPLRGAGPLRAYPPPCQVSDLPPIDLVIISHNHYDHLDYDTISDLWAANEQRGIRFVAPLGNKTWFTQEGLGIDPQRVVDLDWWDELVLGGAQVLPASASASAEKEDEKEEPTLHAEVQVPATSVLEDEQSASPPQPATSTSTSKHEAAELAHSLHDGLTPRERDALQEPELPFLRIICTPAQHQSGRYAVDACSALWSSWVVEYHHSEGEDKERRCFRTFFGGDTGYRFHDTIAAAEREAEAKANQQKRKEAHRKKKQQARASLDGAGNASPLKKLGKRFSLSSKSSRSSASSSGRTNTPRGSGVVNEEPVQTADLPNVSQNNNKESNDDEEEPPILISELEDLAEKKHPPSGEDESSFPACPAFTNIRTVLGTPDLLLLPISVGATISFLKSYDPLPPKWSPFPRVDERLTSAVHMGPEDAVRVFQLMTERAAEEEEEGGEYGPPASAHLRRFAHLASGSGEGRGRGATALAIHWGTFVGGKDEVHQSIRALRRACGKEGVRFVRQSQRGGEPEAGEGEGEGQKDGRNTFALVNHGESVVVRL